MAVKGGFEQAVTVLLERGADANYLDQVSNSQICKHKECMLWNILYHGIMYP